MLLAAATVAALLLSACGTTPGRGGSRPGAYYLDDGPGRNPPANLDKVPDAVPRDEPINRATARPYTVLGRSYTPFTERRPYRERGRASWYGKRYHGQKTSTGEIYDMYAMTAAHTLLPLPCYAKVTSLANGRSVIVRVNDRGPFHDDRIIDLSYAAAYRLGFVTQGSAMVEVESILPDAPPPAAPIVAATKPPPQASRVEDGAGGMFVQLGAFSVPDHARSFLQKMRIDLSWLAPSMQLVEDGGLYKVHAGPYFNREAAERDAERVRQTLGFAPFVLTR